MGQIIGLDLGMTNTRLQIGDMDSPGQLASIELPSSTQDGLPTAVIVDDGGHGLIDIGSAALEALADPALSRGVRLEFKACLVRREDDLLGQKAAPTLKLKCPDCNQTVIEGSHFCAQCGQPLPEDYRALLADRVLKFRRSEAFSYVELLFDRIGRFMTGEGIGGGLGPDDAMIVSFPANWGNETRERYRALVSDTFGIETVVAVCEPEAALRQYLWHAGERGLIGERVLVVDVGGGATDLLVCQVGETGHLGEVKRHGIRFGGADVDDRLINWAVQPMAVSDEIEMSFLLGALRLACRDLKEQLSDAVKLGHMGNNPSREKHIVCPLLTTQLKLDRDTFESEAIAGPLFQYFAEALDEGVREMGLIPQQIDRVLLTGGGSKAYWVRELAEKMFSDANVVSGQRPEMAVVQGLVLSATTKPTSEGESRNDGKQYRLSGAIRFAENQAEAGRSEKWIRDRLAQSGWSRSEIHKAWKAVPKEHREAGAEGNCHLTGGRLIKANQAYGREEGPSVVSADVSETRLPPPARIGEVPLEQSDRPRQQAVSDAQQQSVSQHSATSALRQSSGWELDDRADGSYVATPEDEVTPPIAAGASEVTGKERPAKSAGRQGRVPPKGKAQGYAEGKSPTTAALLSLIPGVGVMYCGEPIRGSFLLGLTIVMLLMGPFAFMPYTIATLRAIQLANGRTIVSDLFSGKKPNGLTKYTCVRCGERIPSKGAKMTFNQMFSGGIKCPFCDCEMDVAGNRK